MIKSRLQSLNPNLLLGLAVCCGLLMGAANLPIFDQTAEVVAQIFMNLLKLVSLPIIFLSIVSTVTGMESVQEFKSLGTKVVKYTLLTTLIASSVALLIYVGINPANVSFVQQADALETVVKTSKVSYWEHLIQVIPSNIVQPFSENNVIGVLFIAVLLSLSSISLPLESRRILHQFFSSLYQAVMRITAGLVKLMPLAILSFIVLFVRDLRAGLEIRTLFFYLLCVVLANLIQGFLVLPALLKAKGISPLQLAKAMLPALSLAFFSKSSNAALPLAIKCSQERAGLSSKVSNFTFPLCTTINMNACAAFILITVLFVSMSNGITYSPVELVMWVFMATLAAVGNAGVPMGCFFLASAFLAAMNVPLTVLGVILPFYSLIDMLETAINVWSDSCVAAVVQQEIKEEEAQAVSSDLVCNV